MTQTEMTVDTLRSELRLLRDAHKTESHHLDVLANMLSQLESRYQTLLAEQAKRLELEAAARQKAEAELDALQQTKADEARLRAAVKEAQTLRKELKQARQDMTDMADYHPFRRCSKCGHLIPHGYCCPTCGNDPTGG